MRFAILKLLVFFACLCITCCAFPKRMGYDRSTGSYKNAENITDTKQVKKQEKSDNKKAEKIATSTASAAVVAAKKNSVEKQRENIEKKDAQRAAKKNAPKGGLESYARNWLGAKYVYGKATKKQTDCSGFVMQVYSGYYGIKLDHNASSIYKDSRAKSVSRGSLKEGDLIFFGSLWKIDHVGIYLNGERFIHASTSKGVMISRMKDKYWSPKYQGARRFR